MQQPTLALILDLQNGAVADGQQLFAMRDTDDDLKDDQLAEEGMCVECQDMPATLACVACQDDFCAVCFTSLHRNGARKKHVARQLRLDTVADASLPTEDHAAKVDIVLVDAADVSQMHDVSAATNQLNMAERAKWIPVRLSIKERKVLRLLEAALTVSDYTDKIDILGQGHNKPERIVFMIKDLCAILCGLVVASDYATGQTLIADKDYKFNAAFFQRVFEVGRRHKIMNPSKMRDTYGKLVYLLMDSITNDQVRELLEFDCVSPTVTVYSTLETGGALSMLDNPLVEAATAQILVDTFSYTDQPAAPAAHSSGSTLGFLMRRARHSSKQDSDTEEQHTNDNQPLTRRKTRREIDREIKRKESAIEQLANKYSNRSITADSIRQCLYSLGDNNSYLAGNRDPIEKMLALLKQYFSPSGRDEASLAIQSGSGGARLSHNHERQYYYVLQSLELWREITINMFKLWCLAELDMLAAGNTYRLRDTGQGLQRIQSSPRVSKEIHRILASVMQRVGGGNWVGSSVVHLGDHNVPNALLFIDKYVQVPRILAPVVSCIEKVDADLMRNPQLAAYVNTAHKSAHALKREILQDFFRHGFDGSGADNFFDAGSCIDGRLTSAWNWANCIEKKPYFPVFLLTGFVGFDGEF